VLRNCSTATPEVGGSHIHLLPNRRGKAPWRPHKELKNARHFTFFSVATQVMSSDEVEVEGQRLPVRRTSSRRLRVVTFTIGGHHFAAIEQNPDKPSWWGQLARDGHQVVQFKYAGANRFVAVAVDGKVIEYGAGKRRGQSAIVPS
jgi:hypothetical protein